MTGLDILTFVVMIVLLTALAVFIKILGALPGKIARGRDHPQAEAINVCGWLGILTLGVTWPVALIWAHTRSPGARDTPFNGADDPQSVEDLKQSIVALSERLTAAEQQLRDAETKGGAGT